MGTGSNVLVGLAQLYIAPASTASPVFAGTGLITTPTTPWVAVGFTESGVTLTVDRKVDEIHVEEQSTPVLVTPNTVDVTIDVTFAEDTIANMATAYGGATVTTTAATSTTPATSSLALAEALSEVALAGVGVNAFGFARLFYVPIMQASGKVKTEYRRTKTPRSYPVTFNAICPLASIVVTDATSAHS